MKTELNVIRRCSAYSNVSKTSLGRSHETVRSSSGQDAFTPLISARFSRSRFVAGRQTSITHKQSSDLLCKRYDHRCSYLLQLFHASNERTKFFNWTVTVGRPRTKCVVLLLQRSSSFGASVQGIAGGSFPGVALETPICT